MESKLHSFKVEFASPVRDSVGVAAIYAPYVRDTAITFEEVPPTADEMAQRIRSINVKHAFLVARRVTTGEPLGYAYATQHRARAAYRWCVDFAVYTSPDAQGQGIGTALYQALIETTRAQGYLLAFAGITEPNASSTHLHRRIGFEFLVSYEDVGFKCGAWHSVSWYRLQLAPQVPKPREPSAVLHATVRQS